MALEFPEGASGDFASWGEAASLCSFDRPEFLDKVFAAAEAVLSGSAVHMRDGSLFDEIQYSWPLLAGLMYATAKNRVAPVVLDFGGGLGVTYLQNRRFLDRLGSVEWHIVERDVYCGFAERRVRHPRLRFHRSIDACLAAGVRPNIILFSSVLMLLPDPWALLASIRGLPVGQVLIDRTAISLEGRDRLTVFRAPAAIVANMTRPMWFFDEARLLAALDPDFELVERFPGFDAVEGVASRFSGYILERKPNTSLPARAAGGIRGRMSTILSSTLRTIGRSASGESAVPNLECQAHPDCSPLWGGWDLGSVAGFRDRAPRALFPGLE